MNIIDLHTIDYKDAWDLQKKYFQEVIDGQREDTILLCEHNHVYTLGRHGDNNNLLVNDEFLKSIGAEFYKIDRGGDITYHGPGQMVVYPILNIKRYNISLKGYVNTLEEAIIKTIHHWGINGIHKAGASGVWLNDEKGERKICAVGVKASRYVTMHGIALNINTDLRYFSYINPCGFIDKGVTSIASETKCPVDEEEVKSLFINNFTSLLGCSKPEK